MRRDPVTKVYSTVILAVGVILIIWLMSITHAKARPADYSTDAGFQAISALSEVDSGV